MENLPSSKKDAADVAKLTIGVAAAITGVFRPGAGALGPIANFALEKLIRRPERILIEELKKANIDILSEEKAAAFIPMAYRFFEAAKEGEYEHNLKILAEYIKNELRMETPEPSDVARMATRIEGLTRNELKVIALINASLSRILKASTDASSQSERPYVSANQLAKDPSNRENFDHFFLQEALTEIASRGLLIPDGAARYGKAEEYYSGSGSFIELIEKAHCTISDIQTDRQVETT
jgi:hypothetical protein